jgi:CRP-like cAMP-binding protein
VILLCIIVHSMTCFLYLLALNEDIGLENTYLTNSTLDIDQAYVKTLYYIITTISTVGYGDIGPKTSKEIAFIMFVEFIGVMIFAYLTGSVTSIITNLNQREKKLSENEIALDKWFLDTNSNDKFKIPIDLQESIKSYFTYFWQNDYSTLLNNNNFLMRMPLNLRNEFIEFLFSDEIELFNVFFSEYEKQLKYDMMLFMYPRIFEENAYIIKHGEEIDEIFVIRRGKVLFTSLFGVGFLSLPEKSFFGEEFVLLNKPANINILSYMTVVECFCLKKSKYLELLNQYPKSFQNVIKRAYKRDKYFKSVADQHLKVDEGSIELTIFRRKKSPSKISNADYLEAFTWNLNEDETDELNELIQQNNEITVKEKIINSLKKNHENIEAIETNIEKINADLENVTKAYEQDVNELVLAINLIKNGHQIEAEDLILKIKNRGS